MPMLEQIGIRRVLADPAANKRKRKYEEHAVVVEMNRQAALGNCFDPMGGRVVPGKLRDFLGLRRKRVSEIQFVPLLR